MSTKPFSLCDAVDALAEQAKLGKLTLSINVKPPDWSAGYHTLFERDRPKVLWSSFPDAERDSFGRKVDDFTFPDDVVFYRGVVVASASHIDHLLDDVCFRLAKLDSYRGVSSFKQRTDEKAEALRQLANLPGPLSSHRGRVYKACRLLQALPEFRNLMAHGHFGLTKSSRGMRLVGVRKFGNPSKGGREFNDSSALLTLAHLARRAARADQLARHFDRLHYLICDVLNLPAGLMETQAPDPLGHP